MKYQLLSYAGPLTPMTGIVVAEDWFDLAGAARVVGSDLSERILIDDLLEDWDVSRGALAALVAAICADSTAFASSRLDPDSLTVLAPLTRPGVIYGAGANYRDHVEAMARAFDMNLTLDPKREGVAPWHFIKPGRATVTGHRSEVSVPPRTQRLDWEAELAVVIGRPVSKVSVQAALDYVAGYACANDLSARDHLVRDPVDPGSPFRFDWIGQKCFAGSCPLGPVLTPAEFVDSPERLDIRLWLNGELKQDSNTANHLYGVAEQIAYLSERMTLYPGDLILTGTPAGVGMETGTFLAPGDVMRVSIEGLGELETRIA